MIKTESTAHLPAGLITFFLVLAVKLTSLESSYSQMQWLSWQLSLMKFLRAHLIS